MIAIRAIGDDDARHALFVRLFDGEFGEELYDYFLLAGPRQATLPASLIAYMALYQDADGDLSCRYISLAPSNLTEGGVARHLQNLNLTEAQVRSQFTQVLRRDGATSDSEGSVEEVSVMLARSQLGSLDLPLVFVTYLSTLSGARKVVLWFVHRAPGNVLFRMLKRHALELFG